MKQFSLDEYLKNPSKKVVTREGKNVRIVCTDKKGNDYPVVALIEWEKTEEACDYTKDGCLNDGRTTEYDLFFASEKHEGWVNVYRDTDTGTTSFGAVLYTTREEAEEVGKLENYYVATAKIEWEE